MDRFGGRDGGNIFAAVPTAVPTAVVRRGDHDRRFFGQEPTTTGAGN